MVKYNFKDEKSMNELRFLFSFSVFRRYGYYGCDVIK